MGFAPRQTGNTQTESTQTDLAAGHPCYAIHVKPHCEDVTSCGLAARGYSPLVPKYRARRRWSDRVKQIELPLFPGYVFCRFDVVHRLPVVMTPGVVSIVSFGREPMPVEEAEIQAIQAIVNSGLAAQPWPFLKVGHRVTIAEGPLTGVEGVILNLKKEYRLVVSVTMLQRSVAVEIDREWARPVN